MTDRNPKEELREFLPTPAVLMAWLVVAAAFYWFHRASIDHLFRTWQTEEDYGHGFVVPLFSLALLWLRRDMLKSCTGKGSWLGLAILAVWAALRSVAVYFNYASVPEYSILVFLTGVALFVGGWPALRWSWPAIAFLFFMIPLPGAVQGAASQWLQGIAARMSGYVIQTLGIPAIVEGHVIQLSDASKPLDVAAACSGLRMLMLFFAMCVAMAFVVRRPLWEKLVLVVSAVPIAVASNVLRIVLTAVFCEAVHLWPSMFQSLNIENPQEIIHNWVGYVVMMPAGLLLLWAEMALLSKLMVEPLPDRPLVMGKMLVGEIAATEKGQIGGPRTPR